MSVVVLVKPFISLPFNLQLCVLPSEVIPTFHPGSTTNYLCSTSSTKGGSATLTQDYCRDQRVMERDSVILAGKYNTNPPINTELKEERKNTINTCYEEIEMLPNKATVKHRIHLYLAELSHCTLQFDISCVDENYMLFLSEAYSS